MRGKAILDLGCGPKAQFARDMKTLFPQSQVVAYDQLFLHPSEMMVAQKRAGIDCVGGYFGDLPFDDQSFDLIVSCFAFPMYSEGEQCLYQGLAEIVRVLRHGGKVHIAPFQLHRRILSEKSQEKGLKQAYKCYGPINFGSIVSPTIVKTDDWFFETQLETITYADFPDRIEKLFSSLGEGLKWQLQVSTNPDLTEPYNQVLVMKK